MREIILFPATILALHALSPWYKYMNGSPNSMILEPHLHSVLTKATSLGFFKEPLRSKYNLASVWILQAEIDGIFKYLTNFKKKKLNSSSSNVQICIHHLNFGAVVLSTQMVTQLSAFLIAPNQNLLPLKPKAKLVNYCLPYWDMIRKKLW